jgi:arabinofuranosyltransferase
MSAPLVSHSDSGPLASARVSSRFAIVRWSAAILLVALGLWHLAYHASYTLDDAYITFRYARNFARGAGLVYNPGDYVKGYSNTLYTLLMTGPELFGRDPIGLSKSLGVLSFATLAAVGGGLYWREPSALGREHALWFLLLLGLSAALAVHCMGGLETGLHTALIFCAVARRLHEQRHGGRPWSALLLAALVMSRPEGIVIFAALAAHDLVFRLGYKQRFGRAELYFYLLPVLVYAAELSWSKHYYGSALPQTYYAKTAAAHGVGELIAALGSGAFKQLRNDSYLAGGLSQIGLGWAALCALPLALLPPSRRRQNSAFGLVVLAQLLFIARAGSDWAPGFRFGVPMLPALFVLLVEACAALAAFARRYERPTGWLLFAVLVVLIAPKQWRESQKIQAVRYVNAENKLMQGAFFASLAEPGITLASFDIGGHGYAAGSFDIFDSCGLTLRETAGCPGRQPARCTHFAGLVMPELVRLHNNRRRDAYVSRGVTEHAPYLGLDHGKYLLRRELLFMPSLPEGISAAEGGTELLASDAPSVAIARASTRLTLYWRNGEAAVPTSGLAERRLEWLGPSGHFNAHASGSVLSHLDKAGTWRAGELFADVVSVEVPGRVGRYQLQVVAANRRIDVASVEVLDSGRDERAERMLAEARAALGQRLEPAALRLFARAVEVSPARARGAYQHAAVVRAQRERNEAIATQDQDPLQALRVVQDAKRILHRAFWQSGSAGRELRAEIDRNGALTRALVAQLLGPE